ncbi:MAG: GtrA family protein [Saprospiraceae bacterium]|nr:GtrA family protein [Saprospiraceae bacterium]
MSEERDQSASHPPIRRFREILRKLFLQKAKFAMTSGIATAVDIGLFWVLITYFFQDQWILSNTIAYGIAVLVNFTLQRFFVFELKRSVGAAFALAMAVSFGGYLLNTSIVKGLSTIATMAAQPLIPKLIATGIVFFYNFYFKKYVFEKQFFKVD